MKKKFNPDLLKEEVNKFKMLSEYDFYQEKKDLPEYKDLLLGDIEEADENPEEPKPEDNTETDVNADVDNVASDLGVDDEISGDIPEPENVPAEEPVPAPVPEPAPQDDAVEVDVTSLVDGTEEAKNSADMASKNSQMLLKKLADLESRVAHMSQLSNKIEGLEQELIKRNPTPAEKLEMRTLSSAPFNQKLTDYWSDKEGAYDVMGVNEKPKEYVLTKDDIDSGFSGNDIKSSFTPNYNEENIDDYEEEEY